MCEQIAPGRFSSPKNGLGPRLISFTSNDQFAVTPTFRRRPRNAGNSDQTFPSPECLAARAIGGIYIYIVNKTNVTLPFISDDKSAL